MIAGTIGMAGMFASASHLDVRDLDDTQGPLDVRLVEVFGTKRPLYRIATYQPWRVKRIYDRGYLLVSFDTFGTTRYDYYALVRSVGSRVEASLWRDRATRRDFKVADLRVYRETRRNVLVRVPLAKMILPQNRRHYHWFVQTLFTNDQCRRVCFDLAPDRASVIEPNPNAAPSPTPTPAVTISLAP